MLYYHCNFKSTIFFIRIRDVWGWPSEQRALKRSDSKGDAQEHI